MVESRQAAYSRRQSEEAAEIGALPPIKRKALRQACESDPHRWLGRELFPLSTGQKPFGEGQRDAIDRIEHAIQHGGLVCQAFPRGFVKTAISVRMALKAILYGQRRFVVLIGSSFRNAQDLMRAIKMELETNDALAEMFPEVCRPIRALEGKVQRCMSQTCGGELTHIKWTSDMVVLPTIKGSAVSGSVIMVRPLEACRGMQYTTPQGKILRPDFFIGDDVQKTTTARSKDLVASTLDIIRRDVLLMNGHSRRLSGVINCTVIEADDVADTLLNSPAWQTVRYSMVLAWPEATETHWLGEYSRLLTNFDRGDVDGQRLARKRALAYYKKHRRIMDKGAKVAWDWGYAFDDPAAFEISALQHAFNLRIEMGDAAFASECQNTPVKHDDGSAELITAKAICAKVNGIERGIVPAWAQHVVGMIDPNKGLLFWGILAAGEGFRCSLIDYGTWPAQKRARFRMRDARPSLEEAYPGMGFEAVLRRALEDLVDSIDVEYRREDGAVIRPVVIMADANWGQYTDVVYEWARASRHSSILLPSHGKFLGATSPAWSDRKPESGEINGTHWRIPNVRISKKPWRHIIFDTNWYKTFVHQRLQIPVGSAGSLELFGKDPVRHELLAEHLLAEKCKPVTYRGKTVNQWELPKNNPDNHWLDVVVGASVAASRAGASLEGMRGAAAPRKTVTFAEIKRRRASK